MELNKDYSMAVCKSCGAVHGYGIVNEYISFYENQHKFRQKVFNKVHQAIDNLFKHKQYIQLL